MFLSFTLVWKILTVMFSGYLINPVRPKNLDQNSNKVTEDTPQITSTGTNTHIHKSHWNAKVGVGAGVVVCLLCSPDSGNDWAPTYTILPYGSGAFSNCKKERRPISNRYSFLESSPPRRKYWLRARRIKFVIIWAESAASLFAKWSNSSAFEILLLAKIRRLKAESV